VIQRMSAKPEGLKLKHLGVRYGVMSPKWFDMVELMKESLVSIQIHNSLSIPIHLPRMPKLKLLDLGMFRKHPQGFRFQDFNNSCPALQYLKLNSENKLLDEFFIGSECCPLIESLNLGNSKVNLQTFERTLEILPNLTELALTLTVDGADILQKIWTEMSQLEKLHIHGRLSTRIGIESLITGISYEEFKKIEKNMLNTLKDMTTEARRQTISEIIKKHRTLPSLGNLTNLRDLKLNMTSKVEKQRRFLSDLTGYFGVYTLKNLRHLDISNCEVSKTCTEILVADMDLDSCEIHFSQRVPRWYYDYGADWIFPSSKLVPLI